MNVRIGVGALYGGADFAGHSVVDGIQAFGARKRNIGLAVAGLVAKGLKRGHRCSSWTGSGAGLAGWSSRIRMAQIQLASRRARRAGSLRSTLASAKPRTNSLL